MSIYRAARDQDLVIGRNGTDGGDGGLNSVGPGSDSDIVGLVHNTKYDLFACKQDFNSGTRFFV